MSRGKKSKSEPKPKLQSLQVSIDVFNDAIVASRYADNGTVERRYVTNADLAAIFAFDGGGKVAWFGDLKNVAAVGQASNGDQIYLVVRPAARTVIEFKIGRKKERLVIQMPSLLAQISRREGKWKELDKVMAFAGKLKPATRLYIAPLPNMLDAGGVCMGSADISKSQSPAAEVFEECFIKSCFTDHTLNDSLNDAGNKKFRNIIDAIRKTKGRVPFRYLEKLGSYGEIFKNR